MLDYVLTQIPQGACVLDYGCWGWKVVAAAKRQKRECVHHGCDILPPPEIPVGATFHLIDAAARRLPCEDDVFDLVIASHVIEHVSDPLALFQELVRVCKPGGLIYIEAPSDRAALCKSDSKVETHSFHSFWDDPTHQRPWPPAALYRLALSYGCDPVECRYIGTMSDTLLYPLRRIIARIRRDPFAPTALLWKARKWAGYAIIRKPLELKGMPQYRYITLQAVKPGKHNALLAARH